ncbi:DEAD/DEAH box helicase [Variovorax sp. GT1P44]|uniref:DEAD/DEAH box helicase n=1 Tax=Variovorax sp. GT1P44 TaxID=3443742 RepID=UPI003F471F69
MSALQLRPYQASAFDKVMRAWEGARAVLLYCPTGGGKTEIALALGEHCGSGGCRVLIVVERKVLCTQWRDRLHRHGIHDVGLLQGENSVREYARILVATAQTIRTRGVPEGVGLVIIDESHIWHQTHDRVLSSLGEARVLGLTATPLREGLGLRFQRLVSAATIGELTEQGYLVPARYYAPKADAIAQALDSVRITAGDYNAGDLAAAMKAHALVGAPNDTQTPPPIDT